MSLVLLSFVITVSMNADATTCVSNKIFKVRHVCGIVVDPSGVPIAGIRVDLSANNSVLEYVVTDSAGNFVIPNVGKGKCELSINHPIIARLLRG